MDSIASSSTPSPESAAAALQMTREAVAKWLHLDCDVVDLALATVLANKALGDPVWILLVAPPSSGKTEIIRGLDKCPTVYPISAVTAHTFVSGWKDEGTDQEPSLLKRLHEGDTLAIKDFGSLLSLHPNTKAEVFHQLREIYDGQYHKEFGTGKGVHWEGRLGLIAGVTQAIEKEHTGLGELGERFLWYRLDTTDQDAVAMQALADSGKEDQMRQEIAAMFLHVMNLEHDLKQVAYAEADQVTEAAIARVLTVLRTPVPRHHYDKHVLYEPAPEGPARVAKALWKLILAVAAIRGHTELQSQDLGLARRIALDSMPSVRARVLPFLAQSGEWITAKDVAAQTTLPKGTVYHTLEDLHILKVVHKETSEPANLLDRWRLTEGWPELLATAGFWVKH